MAASVYGPPSPFRFARGDVSPKIWVEIAGDKAGSRDDITRYQLVGDVRTLYDPFSFDIPNDRGQNTYLLKYRGYPIKIWHADPAVENGRERPWFSGVIVNASQRSSQEAGSVITIAGFDLGWRLTSCAPYWLNLRGLTWQKLAARLVEVNWGFDSIIGDNLNTKLKFGRVDAEYQAKVRKIDQEKKLNLGRPEIVQALFGQFGVKLPRIQIEMGQTVGDVLTNYARLQHHFVGVSALGHLQLWQPDYDQATRYSFHWHAPSSGRRSSTNDIKEGNYELSAEGVYNDVTCCGTVIVGLVMPDPIDPNEGKFVSKYRNFSVATYYPDLAGGAAGPSQVLPIARRKTFMDEQQLNKKQALLRAQWAYQQGVYDGDTLIYDTFGHSKDGVPYIENTMAEVDDSWNGVEEKRYLSRVELSKDIQGTRGRIHQKLPNLLAA